MTIDEELQSLCNCAWLVKDPSHRDAVRHRHGCIVTKVEILIASEREKARKEFATELKKAFEVVPFDPAGMMMDQYMMQRSPEEVEDAKNRNRAHSLAALKATEKIDELLKPTNNAPEGQKESER
jgi:hypothetical protein